MAAINRIPHVHRNKNGHIYFRKGGFRCGLNNAYGSEELRTEVDQILARLALVEQVLAPTAGTIGEVLCAYAVSADLLGNAPSTQADYGRRIREINSDVGEAVLRDVDADFMSSLKAAWLSRGYRVAGLNLQVLKNACMPAIIDGRIPTDPFHRLKKVRRPHDAGEPNPAWRGGEVEAVIAEAMQRGLPGLARAIALGRYLGFRRSSICSVPVSARIVVDGENGRQWRIYWLTKKGQVLADKPEDARLTRVLDETPDLAATIAYNADGKPFNWRSLNQALDRLIIRLAAAGKVRAELTLHGLRHARGVELANSGASDAEIMSQLEHRTTHAAQIYRRQAQRRALADAGQNKIDQALSQRIQRSSPKS